MENLELLFIIIFLLCIILSMVISIIKFYSIKEDKSILTSKTIFVHLDGKKKRDIWFSGFGFVSIKGECDIDCKVLESTEVYFTNAIIG